MIDFGFTKNGFVVDTFGFSQKAGGGCDPAALAFISAAGITDAVQQGAICQLVSDLIASNVWSSLNAIYPFVGGNSTSNSYNLKNTATYQITWFGGVTHNANGVTFNGVNSYGNTGYNENVTETFGNTSRCIYDRSNFNDSGCQIGAMGAGGAYQRNFFADYYGTRYYADIYDVQDIYGRLTGLTINSDAFWSLSRTSFLAGGFKVYKDGLEINVTTQNNVGSQPNVNTYVGGLNANGSLSQPSAHNLAFASMGAGLTSVQVAAYYAAVQTFQTTLGRQV